ncbi:MAG: hypothetical protein GW778_08935 [Alphaproteobacteria bacterium]|nr:hypothetical protein [Alphaproteobacteria bacterium]
MYKPHAIVIVIIGLFSFIQTSFAQITITGEEKAVFAYFKLTNQIPDYEKWIKNSDPYINGRKAEKSKILTEEKERLSWGFDQYNVEKDFINLQRPIRLTTFINQDGKRVIDTRFIDDRHNETPYFPISYGKESIAFIVEELVNYKQIELKDEEIPKVKDYFYDSAPYEAMINIRIRPISADAKNKLFVDYKDQWLMLGDIAYLKIEFRDEYKLEDVIVWDYNAPWYLDESQKALLEMFKSTE